jgi:hypothetical protein
MPNNITTGNYSELVTATSPDVGGSISQPAAQANIYTDVFGDGRTFMEMNQPDKLFFTAEAQGGYGFAGWSYTSDPYLSPAEWNSAFGSAAASAALATNPAISNFVMPPANVKLTANFKKIAQLDRPADVFFAAEADSSGDYSVTPGNVTLENLGEFAANITGTPTLSDFRRNGIAIPDSPFIVTGEGISVTAGGVNSDMEVCPAAGLESPAVYTATMTIDYSDISGSTGQMKVPLAFTVDKDGVSDSLLYIDTDLDFGIVDEGYASIGSRDMPITNYGKQSTIVNVALTGDSADSFAISGGSGTPVAAGSVTSPHTVNGVLSIRPKDNLPAGRYNATMAIAYTVNSGTATLYKDISFRVRGPAHLTSSDIGFGTLENGYPFASFRQVSLTNTGDTNAQIISIVSIHGREDSAFRVISGSSIIPAGGSDHTWQIVPKMGLGTSN